MKFSCFLVVLALGQADARSVPAKVASLIEPALKDESSDKKFFGPNGDYPNDKRPVPQKKILDKLKGPDQPYPALQSKDKFDADYVKDENSDSGAWKAQFEYDALRKKLAKEEGDAKAAQGRADKEGHDVDEAQRKADEAAKNAADAAKNAEDAKHGEAGAADAPEGEILPPSAENLEKLKKKVAEAEEALEKEKKQFEECKKQLEAAKARVEDLKAQHEEMSKKLEGETKLWVETKTVRLNLKKAREEASHAKREAAEARLKVAQNNKAEVDKVLAREKAESEKAHQNLEKQKAAHDQAKKELEKATLRLQKLRGYTPGDKPALKSGSHTKSALSLLAFVAMQTLL